MYPLEKRIGSLTREQIEAYAKLGAFITLVDYSKVNIQDPATLKKAITELSSRFLENSAIKIWPQIDEIDIEGIVTRSPEYDTHKVHLSQSFTGMRRELQRQGFKPLSVQKL